jgi:hypothetical protein
MELRLLGPYVRLDPSVEDATLADHCHSHLKSPFLYHCCNIVSNVNACLSKMIETQRPQIGYDTA